MSVKEIIDQIGGRERLEHISQCSDVTKLFAYEMRHMARTLLAVLDAQQSPVWGQARFKGGEWSSCTAEHAAMVMASPDEWAGYECRYLYATPPAASVPDGYKLAPIEPSKEMLLASKRYKAKNKAPTGPGFYRAMLAAAPAPEDKK
ncbi:MAG: hypothetical protein [Bacteriophage sp.]|nr:MAG: hypothetical protein [Bacteriophage sp.]